MITYCLSFLPPVEIIPLIDDQLLELLRCPKDRSPLSRAEQELVARVNQGIANGQVCNLAGQKVTKAIGAGLVREANDIMYLVVDGIPVMLPDEAIDLSQVN